MLAGRLQILADRHEVDVGRAQIVHQLQHFMPFFAKPDHDARFGEHPRVQFLHALKQAYRMKIARAGTNGQIFRGHRLQIVIEDVRPGGDHHLQRPVLAQEIGRQHFDCGLRRRGADGADRLRKMFGAAVAEVVAID